MTPPSLVAVGDISFGDHPVCASFGVNSMLRARPGLDVFEQVKELLRGHDIVFGNLETVLSDDGLDSANFHSMHMRGRAADVNQLTRAGFNVLNVANNHILQHGERAFAETLDLLNANGILPVGVATPDRRNCQPARLHVRGTEVVFLGYAFESDKYYRGTPLYAQAELPAITDAIRHVKTRDNVVICSFHWGLEFISYPSREQIALARSAIDAGCDLILGHHPHVLNGYERYKGKYVFYSLGNFVFDQLWNDDCTMGMAVKLRLSPRELVFDGADGVRIGRDYRPAVVREQGFEETLRQLCSQIEVAVANEGKEYAGEARRKEARNRYLSWLYLLRSLHRYDAGILKQIVTHAWVRKMRGLRSADRAHRAV
jgi:gamma-polyglutamate biosynthesis protein CapA